MLPALPLRWLAYACMSIALAFLGVLVARGVVAGTTSAESYVSSLPRPAGTPLPVLFRAPTFDLSASTGSRVGSKSLLGKVWIVNFIFTECTSVCPTMTARLAQLESQLRAPSVRFVSISVDPEHDSPAALKAYAEHWPLEPRWLLLSPNRAELDDVAQGLRVAVIRSNNPKSPIVHSRLLTLVDAAGNVRAIYDSDDEIAWRRIAEDARELVGQTAEVAKANTSESPLARFGCNGCHDRLEIAPKLGGGSDRGIALASGDTVQADDDYLRESILKPQRKTTAGYAPLMPSYRDLSALQLDELIAAIRKLPKPDGTENAHAGAGTAEDPICHMKVATVNPALTLKHKGSEVHFCSRTCLETFVEQHVHSKSGP
jgi:protein SCO1